jgi:integrase/recombinase XerD
MEIQKNSGESNAHLNDSTFESSKQNSKEIQGGFSNKALGTAVNLDLFPEENQQCATEVAGNAMDGNNPQLGIELGAQIDIDAARQHINRWRLNPETAFKEWKESQRVNQKEFASHSVEQYQTMFRAYLRWLGERGVALETATREHLDLFLNSKNGRDGKPAAQTTKRRYLHLLNNIYEHLRLIELRKDNPAEPLLDLTRHQDFEKPAPNVLPFELSERYIQWVMSQPDEMWHEARDKALRMIFIGSGMRLKEALNLRREDYRSSNGRAVFDVRAHGFVQARAVPLSSHANLAVLQWLLRLKAMDSTNNYVFPARYFKNGHDYPIMAHIASAETFLTIQEAMTAIGYERSGQGPQTLRNTFIARQIWEGKPVERIMQWCGLQTPETVNRISKMVPWTRADVPSAQDQEAIET